MPPNLANAEPAEMPGFIKGGLISPAASRRR